MAEHNLNSLNPGAFANLVKSREAAVAAACSERKREGFAVNRLAKALHPERQYLRVAEIMEHGDNCKTYVLVPDRQRGTTACTYFSAGQYLSVFVDINGKKYNRPYSIVSSPKDALTGYYRITIKGIEGGLVSTFILENWKKGTAVETSDPMGNFTYEPLRDTSSIVGIAGGSGITPFMSLAKAIAEGDEECSLTLLYGSTDAQHILFQEELDAFQARCPKIRVVYVLSEEEADGCAHGYITADLIRQYAPQLPSTFFICGPRAMVAFVDKQIEELAIERKYIRHELHGELLDYSAQSNAPKTAPRTVRITVNCRQKTTVIVGSSEDSILRILEKNGIAAPSRCRSGECGFCRSRLISGEVYIPKDLDKRRLADSQYGYIHPCCTYPLGDLQIEIAANR